MFSISLLVCKLAPAYVYVLAGFLAKRFSPIKERFVANCLFFVFIPITVFKGALASDAGHFMTLTLLALVTSCILAALGYCFRNQFSERLTAGMVSCLFSYLNIGWFGIPIVQAVYGAEGAAIMTAFYVGGMLFGNTIGYSLATADGASLTNGVRKLMKIPSIYAVGFGLCLRLSFVDSAHSILESAGPLLKLGSMLTSICGMGLVGMSIAHTRFRSVPWALLSKLLGLRFICILVLTFGLQRLLLAIHLLTSLDAKIYLLFAALPIAANILVFSAKDAQAKTEYELVGIALFASTVLSFVLLLAAIIISHWSMR